MTALAGALSELSSRHVLLFGGKGGAGKTTVSTAAALRLSASRRTILFTTDPASNLGDLARDGAPFRFESLDGDALYTRFLGQHLEFFLEIGDRGTYLDREELRRFFELSLPGADELMAWMRIGELAEENEDAVVVVDTAPAGHTLRMLSSSEHFRQLAAALEIMEEKHRVLVSQFTRRNVRDAVDAFIDDFEARARRRRELLTDPSRTAFIPVMLSEPLVVEQTRRLIDDVRRAGIDVPLVVLNRAVTDPDCDRDRERVARDAGARASVGVRVADAPRSCTPLDSMEALREWLDPSVRRGPPAGLAGGVSLPPSGRLNVRPLTFLAGKGGVGKTTCAVSIALQLAVANRGKRYTVISVDPAHSLRDVFAHLAPPENLAVETIDTREKWRRFREKIGTQIAEAVESLTPGGLSVSFDAEVMQQLVEIAPPGADELFAIDRLAELAADESLAGVIVDTAPTGHFLRLLDLPGTAGEWVREFMRLLLRYRELVPAGSLGEELVRASRSLRDLDVTLRSDRTSVIVVTRPERIVIAETRRLMEDLRGRAIHVGGVIANYVTPRTDCPCDRSLRAHELAALGGFETAAVIERREVPPATAGELAGLVPL
jgi:arsenite-transporting ATPase